MAARKKVKKKLKTKKLEDRIAPGMVGGGIVDPGAVDVIEEEESQSSQDGGSIEATQTDSTQFGDSSSEVGNYTQEGYQSDFSNEEVIGEENSFQSEEYQTDGYQAESDGQDFTSEDPGWQEPDWITANADGSIHIEPPEGVTIDDGIANFPVDVANEELPLPEGNELQSDGSLNVQLPEGTTFESDTLVIPEGSEVPEFAPESTELFTNPDGTTSIPLGEQGFEFNNETNILNIDNQIVNEMTPEFIDVNTDGSVNITFPEGAEFNDDGSIDLSPEAAHYFNEPPPDYVSEVEWAEYQMDGSVEFYPPETVQLEDGLLNVPYDAVSETLPVDENININPDGSLDVILPEGTQFDAQLNAVTMPEGSVLLSEIPEGVDAHLNPDGSVTAFLADGMNYDEHLGSVHMDNYWANEISPDAIGIMEDGSVVVDLPNSTEYNADGSFSIPPEQIDFVDTPAPDYVHDAEFSESNGDGSYTINPPESVEIENGMLHISNEVITDVAPMPDEVHINADGTMSIDVPEGTQFDEANGTLTFPQSSVHLDEIPEGIDAFVNPDGTLTAYLPDGIEYSEGQVQLDNYWANEFAPQEVEITDSGDLNVHLPEEIVENPDGTMTIPSESADFIEDPAPEYTTMGPEWIHENPDGSITVQPVDGFEIDQQNNEVHVEVETFNEQFQNVIPDEVTLHADGTMDIMVPPGTEYNDSTNSLNFPQGTVHLDEIPEGVDAHQNPDGSVTAYLADGMEYNAESNTVHMDNYWTNEFMPDPIEMTDQGEVQIDLPADTYYHSDGSFTVPESEANFVEEPCPEYVNGGPEWVSENPDGSVTVMPPEEIQINAEDGTATMTADIANEAFSDVLGEEFNLNSDGTSTIALPEGAEYFSDINTLTFSEGTVHIDEIPEGIDAHINPDGSLSINLPEGLDINDDGTAQLDNYWTNEVMPEPLNLGTDGYLTVDLPSDTQFNDDGSFVISADSADFLNEPEPSYVTEGPEWIDSNPDGSVTFQAPETIEVNPDLGTMSMSAEVVNSEFENYIPDGMEFHNDGSITTGLPEGTTYDVDSNSLSFPVGELHPEEIPEGINYEYSADGSLTVHLPEGIEYNTDSGTVTMDNYWANEITPNPIDISSEGQVDVYLPPDTYYAADGSFTVPEYHTDFIDDPAPTYVTYGPDWVAENPDGSISIQPPEGVEYNSESHTLEMPLETVEQEFNNYMDPDMHFHPDGTLEISLPQEAQYFAETNSLQMPPGEVNPTELPDGINYESNNDGSLTIHLPDGINYIDGNHSVHFDNYWTNEVMPESIEVTPEGQMQVDMPYNTEYSEAGNYLNIPPENADFMNEDYNPEYANSGPEWVEPNPDGSVTVQPPDQISIDSEAGTASMSVYTFTEAFEGEIPEEFSFNVDGSADIALPDGTEYSDGSLTFAPGTVHLNEFPQEFNAQLNDDGTISLQLPEGVEYGENEGNSFVHISNEMLNSIAPEPIEFTSNGEVIIHLPEDTQYFADGSFVISADSTNFLDEQHQNDNQQNYDQSAA